jgi:hypothetical protein
MNAWKLSGPEWNSLKNILHPGGKQPVRRGRPALPNLRPIAEACLFHHNFSRAPRYHSTGWHQLPSSLGVTPSTANRYFCRWMRQGSWVRFCLGLMSIRNRAAGRRVRRVRSTVIPVNSTVIPVIHELERAYSFFNYRFFGNGLPVDILIILGGGSRFPVGRHALGHFAARRGGVARQCSYSIGVNYQAFDAGSAQVCAVLLHEMVHLCNHCLGLVDTCRSRPDYHNMVFRDTALRAGLVCANRHERFGYMQTQLGETGEEVVRDFNPKPVLGRRLLA